MDPNATIDDIYAMVVTDVNVEADALDVEAVLEALDNLRGWLDRGGFAPDAEHVRKLVTIASHMADQLLAGQ